MRSKLFFLLLGISVLLISCKKESPEEKLADTKKKLIGVWEVQNSSTTIYNSQGVPRTTNSNGNGLTLQFSNDGAFTYSNDPSSLISYNLNNVDNKVMITFLGDAREIKFKSDNIMTWYGEQYIPGGNSKEKATFFTQFKRR